MIWGQCFQRAQQGLLPYTASPHTGLVLCPRHPLPSPRVALVNHLSPDKPRDLAEQPGRAKVGLEEVSPLLGGCMGVSAHICCDLGSLEGMSGVQPGLPCLARTGPIYLQAGRVC